VERSREVLGANVEFAHSPYEAAADADTLLILTEWEEFASLDLARLHSRLKYPIIIDGRNVYDPDTMVAHGITYYSVGRSAIVYGWVSSRRQHCGERSRAAVVEECVFVNLDSRPL
jgi:UDPglucose 6-dehydrogenase